MPGDLLYLMFFLTGLVAIAAGVIFMVGGVDKKARFTAIAGIILTLAGMAMAGIYYLHYFSVRWVTD